MAILTKFLQLLKPEKNDYVDVEKHLSENYDKIDTKMEELSNSNDKKLNKGAVSTEYDTAKKIEDKIKEAKETADDKVSKSGDTMTGGLIVKNSLVPHDISYDSSMLTGGFARGYSASIDNKVVAEFGVHGQKVICTLSSTQFNYQHFFL